MKETVTLLHMLNGKIRASKQEKRIVGKNKHGRYIFRNGKQYYLNARNEYQVHTLSEC